MNLCFVKNWTIGSFCNKIESSKENTLENFCGAAFVTFNSIKEQEDYLYQNNKNCCYSLTETFLTLIKVYYYFLIPYFCISFGCFCCFCCGNCCYCSCCNTSGEKEDPLNSYKRKIRFEKAPEPEDIIFENLEISYETKLKNIICISFASFIFISVYGQGLSAFIKKTLAFDIYLVYIVTVT